MFLLNLESKEMRNDEIQLTNEAVLCGMLFKDNNSWIGHKTTMQKNMQKLHSQEAYLKIQYWAPTTSCEPCSKLHMSSHYGPIIPNDKSLIITWGIQTLDHN